MRVSYQWLKEYIDPGMSATELADKFTLSGIEVGSVEPFGSPLPGIVVGQVKALEAHPGRSNLTLVEADVGDKVLSIVCGAKNMRVGDKVAVAKPGSELPGPRLIEEAMLYGVRSAGMLCSASELGLEFGAEDEILILNDDALIGDPVERVLGFDDKILILELTPNRADCLGMIGVAHEVAALTGGQVKMPPLKPLATAEDINKVIKITVEDYDLCPRYTARAVRNVTVGKSPLWLQLKLLKAGIRPISNVVDISNYVMWEFGQPLHFFDMQLLKNNAIVVRRAKDGEKLVTLDGVKRDLDSEVLVIADGLVPVGLAGVMGGENTEISLSTSEVLIEAAAFSPTSIRRTARRYNLPSEASQRFEKGVNPEAVLWSQDRAALLISQIAGGEVLSGVIDQHRSLVEPREIVVDPDRINKILGLAVPRDEIISILTGLGITVRENESGLLEVTVPLRRADISIEEDIAEEVVRIYGFDKIPVTLLKGELIENRESKTERLQNLIRDTLAACGYFECITYSFINPANLLRLRLPEDDYRMQAIPLQNPFSEEQAIMRTTLLPGLLKVVQHNASHREINQMLFEIGSIYLPEALPLEKLPEEKKMLALAVTGQVPEPNWITPSGEADYFAIKGALETLFRRLQISDALFEPQVIAFMHPTRSAVIKLSGESIGFLGQLHPEVAEAWELNRPVTVCEVDLKSVSRLASIVPRFVPLPRYPAAKRDLAIVAPREVSARQFENAIKGAGMGLVRKVDLFDLYEGRQIPEGKRSLAYAITFMHDERTLTDAEVNKAMDDIKQTLAQLGAILRN